MKKTCRFTVLLFLTLFSGVQAQNPLPDISIRTLNGQEVQASSLFEGNSPVIISFWATWCKPCLDEMDAIAEHYEEWQEETGVKLLAISIDDSRTSAKVRTLIAGKDWDYEFYLDPNQDLKRALNITSIPFLFVADENGNIVYKHSSYTPGSEWEIYKHLSKKQ